MGIEDIPIISKFIPSLTILRRLTVEQPPFLFFSGNEERLVDDPNMERKRALVVEKSRPERNIIFVVLYKYVYINKNTGVYFNKRVGVPILE